MIYSQQVAFTLVIDEFQDLIRVEKSIFSEIQDMWDKYKDRSKLNLIVCGSIYSLMVRIFEDEKEPLFRRATSKIHIKPFSIEVMKKVLYDYYPNYSNEDLLCLYAITGGIPQYIGLLMDNGSYTKEKMLSYFCSYGSPFLSDGREILVSEFGRDYNVYFSILQLISSGKTSQIEIDSIIEKNTGNYLLNLNKDYSLIEQNKPIFSKPDSRNTRWKIKDKYIRFWFRFVFTNQTLVESGRYDLLRELIEREYIQYSGYILEDYFRTKYREEGRFTKVGNSWDKRGVNEIDMVAMNELDKVAIVAEIKRNAKKISETVLIEKAASLKKNFQGYEIQYRGLSLKDM
jgi:hypothetical protein